MLLMSHHILCHLTPITFMNTLLVETILANSVFQITFNHLCNFIFTGLSF
jgi:hypothetical protein